IVGVSWLVTVCSRGRLRPPVGWAAVGGVGALGGIGFTVSLLVATLAFTGVELEEAKLGVLTAALAATVGAWLVFRVIALLSPLRITDLVRYAEQLGLDTDRFRGFLRGRAGAARVAADVESADLSRVSGTPMFFINGRRHHGAYDIATLTTAVKAAKARAALDAAAS